MAANILGGLGGLVGSDVWKQFFIWQVLSQLSSALGAPVIAGVTEEAFRLDPSLQLDLAQAVDAVIKSHLPQAEGAAEARLSGIDDRRFQIMLDNAGEPPGLDFLTFAFRRGFIPEAGEGADSIALEQGIRESRLKNKWISVVKQMQFVPPSVGDTVDAWVQNQIGETLARSILRQNGINDDDATILFNTRGRPPGPGELIEMARRGKIPIKGKGPGVVSLEQGIYESAAKDKWEPVYEALMEYLPPPRTITALLRSGSIDETMALELFRKSGLSAELAAVYVANAHHQSTAAARELTKADIISLYSGGVFSSEQATQHLTGLGYAAADAAFELELADFRRVKGLIDKAVSRIHSLYVGHRIDKPGAVDGLTGLAVAPEQQNALLQVWDLERRENVRVLTPAQILDALVLELIDEATTMAMLEAEGYTALDAWYLVAVKLKGNQTTPRPG